MTHYRLYKTKASRIVKGKDIEAPDDKDAMQQAANDEDCPICEVWQSTRKVGNVE